MNGSPAEVMPVASRGSSSGRKHGSQSREMEEAWPIVVRSTISHSVCPLATRFPSSVHRWKIHSNKHCPCNGPSRPELNLSVDGTEGVESAVPHPVEGDGISGEAQSLTHSGRKGKDVDVGDRLTNVGEGGALGKIDPCEPNGEGC